MLQTSQGSIITLSAKINFLGPLKYLRFFHSAGRIWININTKRIPFVLCLPGGVIHKGLDSTFDARDIEKDEYTLEELKKLRS